MNKHHHISSEQIQDEISKTASQPFVTVLETLFMDPKMFSSFDHFREAGFHLVDHAKTKIMAGSHKRLRGYLVKKYDDNRPGKFQLRNYMHRIEGARLLRKFIEEHSFQHVTTPQKFLYALPPEFPERYLVIAENLDLMSRSDTERSYGKLGREQGHELAVILYYFRGLNSTATNLPFTAKGKIAFIDTERWHHDKELLCKIGDLLSVKRRKEVEDVHRELSRQDAQPFVSSFK